MNKTQLRNKRKQLKTERLEILQRIDELQNTLNVETDEDECSRLETEISKLGELLQQKVTVKISDHSHTKSKKKFQEIGKTLNKKVAWSMPYKQYIALKKSGLSDKKIAEIKGATVGQLISWKHKNRITRDQWMKAN